MFITKKHLSRRTFLRAGGVTVGSAAADRDGAGGHRARADGGRAQAAHGILLPAARRDHGQHALRRGDEPLDAREARPRFRPEADPGAVRAAPEIHDRRQRARQPHGREPGRSRDPPGHVALVRGAAAVADAERRHLGRPGRRARDRAGNAAAVAGVRHRRERRQLGLRRHVRLQLCAHDLVPHADHAAADGGRSRQGIREDLRPRKLHRGAQRHRE